MEELKKVKNSCFGTVTCDYYSDGNGEFFMTRQQIGQALEYSNPNKDIDALHRRHKERLDKFSTTVTLGVIEGTRIVNREMLIYSAKGVYEICRWSRQPKADEFYDHVYDILEGLRLGYLKLAMEKQSRSWEETRRIGKLTRRSETDTIKKLAEYAKEQGSTHPDKLYMAYSKLANKMAGITNREVASIMQLNNLSMMENIILKVIEAGLESNKNYKQIYKDCKERVQTVSKLAYLE